MKVRKIFLICLMICAALCTVLGVSACKKEEPEKTYTVSYERGADDATGTIPETVSYAQGAKVTLAAADTFTRSNHKFEKWSYGDKTYGAGEEFIMPANNVTFTATWKKNDDVTEEKDEPTLTELDSKFYSAKNWEYMTNNNGAAQDGGDVPYSLNDGSIKFHRLNQAVEMGDMTNTTASFMLKGTNDWSIWFNSSSKDNSNNYSYRLAYAYGGLRLSLSSASELAAAVISDTTYEKSEWNRFDVVFETSEKVCKVKVYVNGERANLVAGDNVSGVTVSDNVMTHVQPAMFTTGNYMVVKVWEAHNYVQIKPVAKAAEKDVPIIACIGASITEGAGAGNFYTESYPAQLQNALGGSYNVVNFGNSGKTVKLNPEDGEAWLEQNQWKGVQAIVPDMAILNIGTNDSKDKNNPAHDSFKAAYEYLLDQILSVNTEMKIYICTVPYAYSSIYGISNDNIRDIIAPVQREIAAENDYPLIDLYNIVQNKSLLFGDGVHPNTAGYAMFVEIITKVLEEGEAGLTQEFLNYIDEKYNDPVYSLSDVRGKVEVAGDAINLTVTGKLVMDDVSRLRLVVETGTEGEQKEVPMTPDASGNFSGTINLAELTSTKWYNVRVYLTETFYYFLRLAETDCTVGQTFNTDSKLVTVKSWESGGEDTFSFTVSSYGGELIPELEVTETTMKAVDGKIMLTVKGTTNDSGLRLYVGNDEKNASYYHAVTVNEDGTFTIEFDLSTLASGSGWYNVRLYYYEDYYENNTEYYTVLYPNVKNANGEPLKKEDFFLGTDKKITVKSWADWNPLSLLVEDYDSSYTVTPESVKFENGYFVLSGSVKNVNNLYVYLINTNVAGSENNYVEAQISGGVFTAKLPLDTLLAYGKTATPFNLRYKVNDNTAATVNVAPTELNMAQIYWSGVKIFYLGTNNGCAAVYYTTDYAYGLTKAEIQSVDGKATLLLEGVLKDATTLPETVYLLLDENGSGTGAQKILAQNLAAEPGTFKFAVDISNIEGSTEASTINGTASRHYYIRLYTGNNLTADNYTSGTKLADVNSRWLADRLFREITLVGDSSGYYFIRNTSNNTYNTLGIVRVGKNTAIKLGDLDDLSLGYYTTDSATVQLAPKVDANGTTVTYNVGAGNSSLLDLSESGGVLTVRAKALRGETVVTVEVLSNGEHAFDLQFTVKLSDNKISQTNNYSSFVDADSWHDIVNDGNDAAKYDSNTQSVLMQWGNWYQEIGATTHISFELWVNGSGEYGFEMWFRSATNDKTVNGSKYVMRGYNNPITVTREDGKALAEFPRFAANTFTRFDITFFDVYNEGTLVETVVNIYVSGVKVASFTDSNPIAPADGKYFAMKSWTPQIAIRTVSALPNPDAIRVACVGDSITYGHAWNSESYPVYLQTELGDDYNVGNFGHNGASVTGFGGSSEKYANLSEYSQSIAFAPDVIVIMLGSNDANGWANAASVYESELRALITAYKTAYPDAKIMLVTSPPTLDGNAYGIPHNTVENDVNPIQVSVAQDMGVNLVDLHTAMDTNAGGLNAFFRDGDGVHLTVAGAQFAANLIGDAIKSLA